LASWCRRRALPGDGVHGDCTLAGRDDGIELDQIEVSIEEQPRNLGGDAGDGSNVDGAVAAVAVE
jgi:hypothetical protein